MQWDETGQHDERAASFAHQWVLAAVLAPALKDIESFEVLSTDTTNDQATVTLQKAFNSNIVPFAVTLQLQRVGGEWHVIGNIHYQKNNAVSMKLPFTGSF